MELSILQKIREHTLTLLLCNNLRTSGNKVALQADLSFPLHGKLKGHIHFFNGYGERLVITTIPVACLLKGRWSD